ncbi:hypothetical protein TRIATDRAFT_256565 [Trichoderma atroviride IMI 206040]|uniref:Uncharacterized protein n=1 Tax=Hypocrea atroviridis (strain ATCC 20476 / IMI 206040) TaxID=452589 RepID=G9NRT7_HYPAI|nr:uncharacterized protein TRIATDRAFT_256565 [Trichoderma atroviride IMI 206040]EHK46719.1 hypothetical protein TRIATDRAFT_256565 [Trichoderma atroviride IMI 206040]
MIEAQQPILTVDAAFHSGQDEQTPQKKEARIEGHRMRQLMVSLGAGLSDCLFLSAPEPPGKTKTDLLESLTERRTN